MGSLYVGALSLKHGFRLIPVTFPSLCTALFLSALLHSLPVRLDQQEQLLQREHWVAHRRRTLGKLAPPWLFTLQPFNSFNSHLTSHAQVNGPYALITTAVSAELGTHPSLRGSSKALATVTSIIDGTGSIGAALGPFLAGAIPEQDQIFYMLMASDVLALIVST